MRIYSQAISKGILVLLIANLFLLSVLFKRNTSAATIDCAGYVLWFTWVVAGFIAAYYAPKNPIWLAASMTLPGLLISVLCQSFYGAMAKHSDFAGFDGKLFLIITSLPWLLLFLTLGGILGRFAQEKTGGDNGTRT